jgi:hypothetical protein
MTDEQPASASPGHAPAPAPQVVKSIALFLIVMGSLLAIWDIIGISSTVGTYSYSRPMPDALFFPYVINLSIYVDMGLFFIVAGTALAFNRRWGRTVGYAAGVSCFVAWFAAYILGGYVTRLVEEHSIRPPVRQLFPHFDLPLSLTVFGPLVAILAFVLLSLPAVGRWVKSQPPSPSLPNAKMNGMAIASLICALIPLFGITQVGGVAFGVGSLVQIKRSNGALRGRGLSVAGIVISSALLTLVATFVIVATFILQ